MDDDKNMCANQERNRRNREEIVEEDEHMGVRKLQPESCVGREAYLLYQTQDVGRHAHSTDTQSLNRYTMKVPTVE